MAQLNVYVPEDAAAGLRASAQAEGISLSSYVVKVLTRSQQLKTIGENPDVDGWPTGYFDNLGTWEGDFVRADQGDPEERRPL